MGLATYMAENGLNDAQLAVMVGVSAEAVRLWRHGKRSISAKRAVEISALTGIPRYQLRPDLWDRRAPRAVSRTKHAAASSVTAPPVPDSIIDEMITIAGDVAALAGLLGVKASVVSSWRSVPASRVLAVEAATGIPRTRLRPDLYPPEGKTRPETVRRVA